MSSFCRDASGKFTLFRVLRPSLRRQIRNLSLRHHLPGCPLNQRFESIARMRMRLWQETVCSGFQNYRFPIRTARRCKMAFHLSPFPPTAGQWRNQYPRRSILQIDSLSVASSRIMRHTRLRLPPNDGPTEPRYDVAPNCGPSLHQSCPRTDSER